MQIGTPISRRRLNMEQKDVDVVKVDTNEDSSNTEKAPLDTEQPSVRYIYSFLCFY